MKSEKFATAFVRKQVANCCGSKFFTFTFSFFTFHFFFIRRDFLHAVLEGPDTFAGTTHEFWNFFASEEEQDDGEDDEDFLHPKSEK